MTEKHDRPMKRVQDSEASQIQVVNQSHLNGYNRVFGGQLMSWMDVVAAVVARRHSGKNVTTVRVEDLVFTAPAYANDTLVLTGHMAYVGSTSMIVTVRVYVEALNGARTLTNQARFVMVALDEHEKPTPVPGLLLETEAQRQEWAEAESLRKGWKSGAAG